MASGNIERILELLGLLGKSEDPTWRALLRMLMVHPNPRLEANLIRLLTTEVGDASFDPPVIRQPVADNLIVPGSLALPELPWASVKTSDRGRVAFSSPLDPHHTLIIGRTGSGKSCVAAKMLESNPLPTWIVDPEGDIAYQNVALRDGYEIVDCSQWKWNPLDRPAGCRLEDWLSAFVSNAGEAFYLGEGGRALLVSVLQRCRAEHGDAFGLRQVYDSLIQSRYRWIHGGRGDGFFESVRSRFDALLVHEMFDCVHGADLNEFMGKRVLFLCSSLSPDLYVFLVNHLFQWLRWAFKPTKERTPKLLLIVEELHRLTNPQRLRRANIAEPIALDAVRTLAKRGIPVWLVDQSPAELPPVIMGNTVCRVVLHLNEARDLDAVQRSLGLSLEQRNELAKLMPRTALVQYANPNHPDPFLVDVDEVALDENVEARVAGRIAQTHARLRFEALPAREPGSDSAAPNRRRRAQTRMSGPLTSKAASDYLIEIAPDQFEPISIRDRRLNIDLSEGNGLRKELVQAGLIALETVNTHGPSKKIINARITAQGSDFLQLLGVPYEKPRGRGSWEHQWHQHAVAKWARTQGYRALIEHMHDGKAVDVSIDAGEKRIAGECLIHGVVKDLANLRDLFTGYDEVWFCVADQKTAKALEGHIAATFGDEAPLILERVRFKLLREFQVRQAAPRGSE
jgi:hypothetical protein